MTKRVSTGPRSAEGKARSSMNALKSGIYSKSVVIPGENRADLDALTEEYYQRFQPALPEQRDQVDILIRSTWTLRRLAVAEAQVWIYEMDEASSLSEAAPIGHMFTWCDRILTRLHRIINTTQRNYREALHELERLQALHPEPIPAPVPSLQANPQPIEFKPPKPTPEFVSSTPEPACRPVPDGGPDQPQIHPPGATIGTRGPK